MRLSSFHKFVVSRTHFILHSQTILCCIILLLEPFSDEVSTGKQCRTWHYHTERFLVLLHVGVSEQEGEKKKKTFSHFVLYMMPVALACPTKQQHIIKNWISSPVFKIFMWAACAELKWTWSEEVEPLYAGLLGYDTSVERHDPVFRWLSCSMSCYFNRTQHLWENETYIYFLLGLCKRYRDKLLSHL